VRAISGDVAVEIIGEACGFIAGGLVNRDGK